MAEDPNPPVDPHLRAALRHAPDRDAAPPAALSEAIRAAARTAVPPAPPRAAPWWRRVWQASGRPRGPWGAALASLAVLALTLGLWRGEELPPPVAPREAAAPPAPTAALPAAPAPAQSAGAELVAAANDHQALKRMQSHAASRVTVAAPAAPAAPAPTAPKAPAVTPQRARQEPAAAPVADAAQRATAERGALATAGAERTGPDLLLPAPAARPAPRGPLSALQQRLASADHTVVWRDDDAPAEAAGPTAQGWLQALDTAAAGRWQAGAGPPGEPVTRRLRWLQGDRALAEAQVLGGGVRFVDAGDGSTWYVALPAPLLETLRRR